MTENPFQFELTREFVAALPDEGSRAMFSKVLDLRDAALAESDARAADREFSRALVVYGSEQIAERLISWDEMYHFTHAETELLLSRYWEVAEAWSGNDRLREGMFGLLRRVAPLLCPDGGEPLPAGTLTVYRGNLGEEPGGGSWTLDPEVASRLSTLASGPRGMFLGIYREDGIPTVWRGDADASAVLGYFGGRGESEVVLEAGSVRNVTKIKEAIQDV